MNKNVDIVERYTLLKNKNGITLVALIVTIIILLILAGISIAQLTGNGLFEKAKLAKEKQENAEKIENEILQVYQNEIEKSISNTARENNVVGYIDTSNKIQTFSIKESSNSYTATENCYITASLATYGGTSISIYINDVGVLGVYNNNSLWVTTPFTINLAKGDTIKFIPTNYNNIMGEIKVWKIK